METAIIIAFQAVLLGVFVFMFTRLENRLENRIDRLAQSVSDLRTKDLPDLRKDLAEEFRAQRTEVSAQITAITNAILASRDR
jgi:hypothetical protein